MWSLILAACGPGDGPGRLDLEAMCADTWARDDCASGDCTPLPVNQDYAAAFLEVLQSEAGWTDAQMSEHVALRHVQHDVAEQSSYHEITVHIDVDWARFLFERGGGAPGGEPAYDDILAAFEGMGAPQVDLEQRLRLSVADIERAIEDCEDEQGVTLDDEGWCSPWFPTQRGDDDTGLRYDFFADLGNGDFVQLAANAVTGEVSCRRYGITL